MLDSMGLHMNSVSGGLTSTLEPKKLSTISSVGSLSGPNGNATSAVSPVLTIMPIFKCCGFQCVRTNTQHSMDGLMKRRRSSGVSYTAIKEVVAKQNPEPGRTNGSSKGLASLTTPGPCFKKRSNRKQELSCPANSPAPASATNSHENNSNSTVAQGGQPPNCKIAPDDNAAASPSPMDATSYQATASAVRSCENKLIRLERNYRPCIPELGINHPTVDDVDGLMAYSAVRQLSLESTNTTVDDAHASASGCGCMHSSDRLQLKIDSLNKRMESLRWRVECGNYLNWLNAPLRHPDGSVAVTGLWAPPPNPNMEEIRVGDVELRRTLALHERYCEKTWQLEEEVRMSLRSSEFNNWSHTDAHLIRYLRQMYVDLELTTPHIAVFVDDLDQWLAGVYRRYNQVPFHNFKHAFMVAQMSYCIIWNAKLYKHMSKLDQLTLITAAINHDLDHPGFNNAYQINAGTQLAMRYNDRSPLENHHASTTFDILYGGELNPFRHLEPATILELREGIIRCILATDMSCHNDLLNQFKEHILSAKEALCQLDQETGRPIWASDRTYLNMVMSIIIKVSDISNECRPLDVATPWIDRLLEEFFHQSDYEKKVNLPTAPFMDREKVTKCESQFSFITYVIMPLFGSLCELFPDLESQLLEPAKRQLEHYTDLLPDT